MTHNVIRECMELCKHTLLNTNASSFTGRLINGTTYNCYQNTKLHLSLHVAIPYDEYYSTHYLISAGVLKVGFLPAIDKYVDMKKMIYVRKGVVEESLFLKSLENDLSAYEMTLVEDFLEFSDAYFKKVTA